MAFAVFREVKQKHLVSTYFTLLTVDRGQAYTWMTVIGLSHGKYRLVITYQEG